MIHQIANAELTVRVKAMGAELTSIRSNREDLEFLWQGDPKWWTGQSYILFPIIGGLVNGRYTLGGKSYDMKAHGFARNMVFAVAEQTDTRLVLHLGQNEATLAQYPFRFDLFVSYELDGSTLRHGLRVVNRNDEVMPFSVGAHPGFNCPLLPGETMSDYRLVFEQRETLESRIKTDGLLTGERVPFLTGSDSKPLDHSLFKNGAAILKGVQSRWLEIRNTRNPHVIRVGLAGFPDLGIWSAANDGPYVCIEPWFGVDSMHGDDPAFEKKEGLVWLEAGKTFDCSYDMSFWKEA